jgi:hypothetical protein
MGHETRDGWESRIGQSYPNLINTGSRAEHGWRKSAGKSEAADDLYGDLSDNDIHNLHQ